jgi:hypothetical protein
VPDYAVVGGNPARLLRHRFGPEAIAAAEHSQWWLTPPGRAKHNYDMTRSWSEASRAERSEGHDEQ